MKTVGKGRVAVTELGVFAEGPSQFPEGLFRVEVLSLEANEKSTDGLVDGHFIDEGVSPDLAPMIVDDEAFAQFHTQEGLRQGPFSNDPGGETISLELVVTPQNDSEG